MKIEIKNRWNNSVIWTSEDAADLRDAIQKASALKINLRGAYLGGANLWGAYLGGAYLGGANLGDANLRGAKINDLTLIAIRQIGPLGSRKDFCIAFRTDKGLWVRAGCFWGDIEKFKSSVTKTHGENEHGQDYMAWIEMCEKWNARELAKEAK